MKYAKMLGLAAVAAMALTAFLGASSASATVLCKTEMTSGCGAAGWDYPAGTVLDMSLEGTTTTETSGGTVLDTCKGGTLKGPTTNTGGTNETVSIGIEVLTYTECTKTTTSVSTGTGTHTYGTLEIHWISGTDNGTVTALNTKVTKNTIFGSCVYGAAPTGTHIGTLTATPGGNSMATLHLEGVLPLIEGGGLCPTASRSTGSYTVTSPEPLHVSTS